MFKIGNFYYPDGGGAFWENLIISILGTLLGAGFAWLFFKKTLESNRAEDKVKYEKYLKSRMKFLLSLIKEVIKYSEKQIEEFEIQARSIIENAYKIHVLKLIASNQISRLKAIDSQDIFEAFIFLFKNEEDVIDQYNKLLYHIDYLDKSFEQICNANDLNITNMNLDYEKMRISANTLYSNFIKYTEDSSMHDIKKVRLQEFDYFIYNGELDIKNFQENFLIPLFENVEAVNTHNRENKNNFIISIREVTTTIDHFRGSNEHYALNTALKLKIDLKECLLILGSFQEKIEETIKIH